MRKFKNLSVDCDSVDDSFESMPDGLLEDTVDVALNFMYRGSYYAPYLDRYPVKTGDYISPKTKAEFVERNTFACTDSEFVYLDVEEMKKQFIEEGFYSNISAYEEIQAVLAHEYTHIICEHTKIHREVLKKYDDKKTGTANIPSQIWHCHLVAAEIQANRGALIDDCSYVYKKGVTDNVFPETKECKTYDEILEALLESSKENEKKMKQAVSKIKDMIGNSGNSKSGSKHSPKPGSGSQPQSDDESEYHKLTQEEIEEAIEYAKQAEHRVAQEHEQMGGSGGIDPFLDAHRNQTDIRTELSTTHKRWEEKRVKAEMKKVAQLIRGNLTRQKVSSYSRPSTRPVSMDESLIKKGRKYRPNVSPRVLIAMDSSGSMNSASVTAVTSAIEGLYKDLGRPKTGSYVCMHDNEVSHFSPLSEYKKVVSNFCPSGGNDFSAVLRVAVKNKCNVVLNVGDGLDVVTRSNPQTVSQFNSLGGIWVDVVVTRIDTELYGYKERDKRHGIDRLLIDV